jgi:hypothetical protein
MHSLATTGWLDAPANGMAFGAAIEGDWRPSLLPRGPVLVVSLTLVGGVKLSQDAAARNRPGWPYSVWHECAQVGHGVFGDGRLRGEDFYGMEVAAEPPPAPPPRGLHAVSSRGTACAAREWECDVGAVSVVAGAAGGLTSLRRRHGRVRRHARGMSAARDSSPAVQGTDAPGQRVTVM